MKLIDKSALVAEIDKRRKKNARNKLNLAAAFEDNYLLSFLDTLEVKEVEEEHTNRTPADIASAMQEVEEKSRAFTEAHQGESSDGILAQMRGEEPVSEEFEEALANEWKGYNDRGAATFDALEDNTQELAFSKGFYRGAKWQEKKDQSTIALAEDHAMLAGMEKAGNLKKLADAMYNAAQNMTTDASRLRKAMDDYHQYVNQEYYD